MNKILLESLRNRRKKRVFLAADEGVALENELRKEREKRKERGSKGRVYKFRLD